MAKSCKPQTRCIVCGRPAVKMTGRFQRCPHCGLTGLRERVTREEALAEARRHFSRGEMDLARTAIAVARDLRMKGTTDA